MKKNSSKLKYLVYYLIEKITQFNIVKHMRKQYTYNDNRKNEQLDNWSVFGLYVYEVDE